MGGVGLRRLILVIFISLFCMIHYRVPAWAASFNTQNFRPSPDTGFYLAVMGSQPLQKGRWSLGLMMDYSSDLLALLSATGVKTQDVIAEELALHLVADVQIFSW